MEYNSSHSSYQPVHQIIENIVNDLGMEDVQQWLFEREWGIFLAEPPDTEPERTKWLQNRISRDLYGYLLDQRLEVGLKDFFTVDEIRNEHGAYVPVIHAENWGPEDIIEELTDDIEQLGYLQEDEEPRLSTLRGQGVGAFTRIEMLLLLTLVFYMNYFKGRDAGVVDAFTWAITKSSGLGSILEQIEAVEAVFIQGVNARQKREGEALVAEQVEMTEKSRDAELADLGRQYRIYVKQYRDNDEEMESVKSRLADLDLWFREAHDVDQQQRTIKRGEQTRLERQLEGLQHEKKTAGEQLDRIEHAEQEVKVRYQEKIEGLKEDHLSLLNKRHHQAEKLRHRCKRLLNRPTPFSGLDFMRIRDLKNTYRNPLAHEIDELLRIKDYQALQDLLLELKLIVEEMLEKNICPKTARVIGRYEDVYQRDYWLLAEGTLKDDQPIWDPERLLWIYSWHTLPIQQDDECFVVGKCGRLLFDPHVQKCADLKNQLLEMRQREDTHES